MIDYSKVKGRIIELFDSYSNFAAALGKDKQYVSRTINNARYLTQPEVLHWAKVLRIDISDIGSYFYALKVAQEQHKEAI